MSDVSRRSALQVGMLGAALGVFGISERAEAATTKNLYSRSRFTPLVNSGFTFATGTSKWSATLVQVNDLSPDAVNDDNRFGLSFRTDKAGPAQGIYSFSRPGFTATTLFVIPDLGRRYYTAIINRV